VAPGDATDPLEVYIPNADTRAAIGTYHGVFRAAELSFFARDLVLKNLGLTDARGLEKASRTEVFDVSDNAITQIGDLSGMQRLRVLDLSNNSLSVVSGISVISTLQEIDVSGNSLEGLPSLARMKSLNRLDVRSNSFTTQGINEIIDTLYDMRFAMGRENTIIRLEGNSAPGSEQIDKIEGSGQYVGEGLKDMGCIITYDAA